MSSGPKLQTTVSTLASSYYSTWLTKNKDGRITEGQVREVTARILFIDPWTRAVGLTMNPHLVHNKAPPLLVKAEDIYDSSWVFRIDRGFGLLLNNSFYSHANTCIYQYLMWLMREKV